MNQTQRNKFGAKLVEQATQSFLNFHYENERTEFLIMFLVIGAKHISKNKEEAKKELMTIYQGNSDSSNKLIEYFESEKADSLFDASFYERHVGQMTYARSIDNFITYFKDVLAEIVIKRPQVLKSKDQEKLEFILSFETMEDLLKAISEKKIEELFYKGIVDIEKFFQDRLGIDLFKEEDARKIINRLIKQRNLVVHNRGKISKEFVKEFPESGFPEGVYMSFTYKDISKLNLIIHNYLVDLDIEISSKFELDLIKRS